MTNALSELIEVLVKVDNKNYYTCLKTKNRIQSAQITDDIVDGFNYNVILDTILDNLYGNSNKLISQGISKILNNHPVKKLISCSQISDIDFTSNISKFTGQRFKTNTLSRHIFEHTFKISSAYGYYEYELFSKQDIYLSIKIKILELQEVDYDELKDHLERIAKTIVCYEPIKNTPLKDINKISAYKAPKTLEYIINKIRCCINDPSINLNDLERTPLLAKQINDLRKNFPSIKVLRISATKNPKYSSSLFKNSNYNHENLMWVRISV